MKVLVLVVAKWSCSHYWSFQIHQSINFIILKKVSFSKKVLFVSLNKTEPKNSVSTVLLAEKFAHFKQER